MTRQEFLYQLADGLMDLPPEERISALKYYEEYFEDAGPDQEQEVLRELVSPQEVARSILADYAQREPGGSSYYGGPYEAPPPPPSFTPAAPRSERSAWATVLIVLAVLIFGWPLIGVFFSLVGVLIALTVSAVVGCVGLLVGGIVAVVGGIVGIAASPAGGLMQLSAGLASTGLGLLFLLLGVWLVGKALPRFIRWLVAAVRRLFRIDRGGNPL